MDTSNLQRLISDLHKIESVEAVKIVKSLSKIFNKILCNPSQLKYHDLNFSKVSDKFNNCPPAIDLLYEVGFKKIKSQAGLRLQFTYNNHNVCLLGKANHYFNQMRQKRLKSSEQKRLLKIKKQNERKKYNETLQQMVKLLSHGQSQHNEQKLEQKEGTFCIVSHDYRPSYSSGVYGLYCNVYNVYNMVMKLDFISMEIIQKYLSQIKYGENTLNELCLLIKTKLVNIYEDQHDIKIKPNFSTKYNGCVKFKKIDDSLAQYYERLGIQNYYDENGIGLFLNHIQQAQLDDPLLSIEEELGDYIDPNACNYTEMDAQFPIPLYIVIPNCKKTSFIFYILQYCYKYNKPPSDEYI
eukprot:131523_1